MSLEELIGILYYKLKISCNKEAEKSSLCSNLLKTVFPAMIEILALESLLFRVSCEIYLE
jgi:hypothetical protein